MLLEVFDAESLERILTEPGLEWPGLMGVLDALTVLHGDPERVRAWVRLGESAPVEKFRAALEAALPGLVVESYGRILSCGERGNTADLKPSVWEVLNEMTLALCLLNRRWLSHDYYQGLIDAFAFPKLPQDFRELAPALWAAHAIEDIVPRATTLVENFYRLLVAEGIPIHDYRSVEEVPL